MTLISAGHAIVRTLSAHGIDTVFSVPGESFLEVLDGLHDSPITNVVCRHEGGASYAAEATGKLGAMPGIAMVTRGPGAANAMVGVHTAHQDATPMVLFVGLVPLSDRDRESFQEFDIRAWFSTTTKGVFVLDDADRASAVVARALSIAQAGRPGPVVVGLPEEVLRQETSADIHPMLPTSLGSLASDTMAWLEAEIAAASRPLLILGGSSWTVDACRDLTSWAEAHSVPVAVEWRGEGIVSSMSPIYIGALGYGRLDSTARAVEEADLVVAVGTVLGDVNTDGYSLRQDPMQRTVIVNADPLLLGHGAAVSEHIIAAPVTFVGSLCGVGSAAAERPATITEDRRRWIAEAHSAYRSSLSPAPTAAVSGTASMSRAMILLAQALDDDERISTTSITLGAGNHTAWAAPFFPTRDYGSLLSAHNGSMGYSIPAAVAVGHARPDTQVIAICGDGEFMMNANELATAAQQGHSPLIVVMDNGQFGTIRSHQEHWHPGRVSGTQISNPHFAAFAEAVAGVGFTVTDDAQLDDIILAAVDHVARRQGPALIHVKVAPEVLLP